MSPPSSGYNNKPSKKSELCLPPDFTLLSCSAYSLTLTMVALCSYETSVEFQRITWNYIPGNRTLHKYRCENLKSYKFSCCFRLEKFLGTSEFMTEVNSLYLHYVEHVPYVSSYLTYTTFRKLDRFHNGHRPRHQVPLFFYKFRANYLSPRTGRLQFDFLLRSFIIFIESFSVIISC
jgi:hypothetical protein